MPNGNTVIKMFLSKIGLLELFGKLPNGKCCCTSGNLLAMVMKVSDNKVLIRNWNWLKNNGYVNFTNISFVNCDVIDDIRYQSKHVKIVLTEIGGITCDTIDILIDDYN